MSPEALAKPIITKNSSEFKLDVYASIPAGELVVFAVQVLQADVVPVAVEEVVSTCFRFFPHSFALKNYFYWPDSALVSRRLHDAKEKGLLKGNPSDGFETKVQGRQVARHVAKTLGVLLPVPPKVEAPVPPVEKKEEVAAPAVEKAEASLPQPEKVEAKLKPPVKAIVKKVEPKPKKVARKKQAAKPKVKAKKETVKLATSVKKKPSPSPKAQPKKTSKPAVKVKIQVKQKQTKPVPKPKVTVAKASVKVGSKLKEGKKRETRKKDVQAAQKLKSRQAQPKQLTMSLTPPTTWKKAEVPAARPKVKPEAQPVKGVVLAPVAVSKEEKVKAAKVVKQIERSDAYQLYRRNGRRAQIGEFDFRNMLFATMESSAETLKRNVDLFKRYAGIHFRTDLIAFLEFCEENFSALLISKANVKGKR